ncbi:MAG: 4-hydroxythreonine-4-phosphate dehydrogenase PdxA [Gammaproteobacteria bacterium]|nr:4-hydroxythreonine-4-phosphate dehydrogenase PdxA [Gammaproteobacteria bacterium]
MTRRPRLAFTPGEPAGIGPDLAVLLDRTGIEADILTIADPDILRSRAVLLGRPLLAPADPARPGDAVVAVPAARPATAGVLDAAHAAYVLACLRRAVEGCLAGEFDALVTGPVHKGVIATAGFPFTGHTEFLAAQAGVDDVVMMLTAGSLRVALVTTHVPLRDVAAAITPARLDATLRIVAQALHRDFGLVRPRVAVLGLNPHAGEQGHMGREEIDVLAPALARAQDLGVVWVGPLPADTAFVPAHLRGIDAVVAMYHDQGLPVLKAQGFGMGINITLGLPFIRTSVDHGTALDKAGTGAIDTGSLREALLLAAELGRRRAAA